MDRDCDFSLVATGDVYPCRFVKLATTADNAGLAAGANDRTIGISGTGTNAAPGTAADTGYLAKLSNLAGLPDTIPAFGPGRKCLLELGGTVARGDYIKSGAAGVGITSATSGPTLQYVGAVALQSGISGDKILVLVLPPTPYYPALS